MNEYFVPGAVPAPNSPGSSAIIRAEFTSIAAAFDKLPVLAGSAGEFVVVNETGTAMIASGYLFSDFVTLSGTQTLTNKTLAWADNTWSGFGTGATKTAGTGADNVLLLAEDSKFPALDGSLLTNLNPGELGVVPIANGGTGADTLAGAKAALGINLKADANNAVLTGAPTCPTPPVGNSSARIANTQFVTDTVTAIGAAIPSEATPLMDGVATPGVHASVSRDDHVHPVDTSRAPASAAAAAGTSFTPAGGVAATNVQAAISELDTEKAPLASPALTGTPTSTTPLTSDNSTRIASTAFVQSLLAQQPPGVKVSDSAPLMNGAVAPGTGVEASRYDHVHPTDTSRAPAGAATATGTSFSPVGGIAATNVQAAISELDTEKAPLASPALTGTPTSTTPLTSDNSTRIATTAFMQSLLAQQPPGAEVSDSTPLMNGVAAPGVHTFVARDDHVHPVDTSRAPAGAATATGTSFSPVGGIAATNVQAAISELDTEKAPLASPALTGTPTSTTPLTSDNSTRIATTAFMRSLLAQQSLGFRNILINGDMRINQRGVTIATAANGAYGPDRWKKVDASNMTQIVESGNFVPSATYTLSGTGVTTQQITSPASGNWTLPNIPIVATNVQLEEGSIATPFEHRPIGVELVLCQRYCLRIGNSSSRFASFGVATTDSPTSSAVLLTIPCQLRATPTLTFSNLQFTGGGLLGVTSLSVDAFLPNYGVALLVRLSGGSVSGAGLLQQNSTPGGFIQMSAEL